MQFGNVDAPDGTPLLDIEPNVSAFDRPGDARIGWLATARGEVSSAESAYRSAHA